MASAKPLTKDDLKTVLKDLGVATKEDLKAMENRQDKKIRDQMGKHHFIAHS